MKKLIVLIFTALLLVSCASNDYRDAQKAPETSYVPVYTECPAIKNLTESEIQAPDKPINQIDEGTPDNKVSKLYVETVLVLSNENEKLRDIILSCKTQSEESENDE